MTNELNVIVSIVLSNASKVFAPLPLVTSTGAGGDICSESGQFILLLYLFGCCVVLKFEHRPVQQRILLTALCMLPRIGVHVHLSTYVPLNSAPSQVIESHRTSLQKAWLSFFSCHVHAVALQAPVLLAYPDTLCFFSLFRNDSISDNSFNRCNAIQIASTSMVQGWPLTKQTNKGQ